MGFVRRLVSVLKPEVLLTHRNDGVELLDKQSGMRVRLFGLPARFTAVHVEGIGHVGKLKDRGQEHNGHLRRVCDYVLVAESDDSTRVVFVELKGTWSTGEKPRDQLRRSLPLLNYLRSVCEVEYEEMLDEGRSQCTSGPISLFGGGEAGGNWIRQGVVRSGGGSGGRVLLSSSAGPRALRERSQYASRLRLPAAAEDRRNWPSVTAGRSTPIGSRTKCRQALR